MDILMGTGFESVVGGQPITVGRFTALRSEASVLTDGTRGKALLAISGGWSLLIGVQMVYPVLLSYIRVEYGLSLTMAGFLFTTIWLGQAVGQLPAGVASDRLGGKAVLIAGTLLGTASLTLVVLARSPIVLYVASAVLGVGLAGFGIARFTVLYELFPERVGASSGIVMAAADAGQTVLPPIAGLVAIVFVWQFGFVMVIPLLLGIALWLKVAVPTRDRHRPEDDRQTGAELWTELSSEFRKPTVVIVTAILITFGVVWTAFTGLYPTYLIEVKGLSETTAALLFGSFFGAGVLVKPVSGSAYDAVGIRRSLLIVVGVPVVAFLAIPSVGNVFALVVLTMLTAPLLGSGAIIQPYLLEFFPETSRSMGLASVRTVFLFVAAVSPTVFGSIAENGLFDEMYYIFAGLSATCVVLALLLPAD